VRCTASSAGDISLFLNLTDFINADRKLIVTYSKAETPAILAFSGRLRSRPLADAEETTSADYQNHLATFLASLVFWQDLLDHCTSVDIKQTLLDHFRFLFLQQLL
jgi:hypothetical protein